MNRVVVQRKENPNITTNNGIIDTEHTTPKMSAQVVQPRPSDARRRALKEADNMGGENHGVPMVSNFFPIERYYDAADKVRDFVCRTRHEQTQKTEAWRGKCNDGRASFQIMMLKSCRLMQGIARYFGLGFDFVTF